MSGTSTISVGSVPGVTGFPSARYEIEWSSIETDDGIVAPWWLDVVIDRVASTDGGSLPRALVDEYERLSERLDDLLVCDEVERGAIEAARRVLFRAQFAGAVAPRMSWHRDAVVLFWTSGRNVTFFTIEANSFSYLGESDGVIVGRRDDFPLAVWDNIFKNSCIMQ